MTLRETEGFESGRIRLETLLWKSCGDGGVNEISRGAKLSD